MTPVTRWETSHVARETRMDLVALGEPLVVFVPVPSAPLRSAATFRRSLAGAECNVVRGIVRLGGKAGLITRIGADEFGAYVEEELAGAGVETSAVRRDPDRATGIYFRQVSGARARRSLAYYRAGSAASALEPSDVDVDYLTGARAFLTTGITALLSATALSAVEYALRSARAAGVTTLFDPNLRPGLRGSADASQLLIPLLEHVDIFLGGERETRILFSCEDPIEDLAERVRAAGPAEVVLKRGWRGAGVLTRDGWFEETARPITVRDSVGAGDAFNAGYVRLRQDGEEPQIALIAGSECGAAACIKVGDFENFPDAEALMRLVLAARTSTKRPIVSSPYAPSQDDGLACN